MVEKLGALLIRKGLVTPKQVEQALQAQLIYGGRFGSMLVEHGFLSVAQLAEALGEQRGFPVATQDDFERTRKDTLAIIGAELAEKHNAFPLSLQGRKLKVAFARPYDPADVDAIAFATGLRIVPYIVPELLLNFYLQRRYNISREEKYIRLGPDLPRQRAADSAAPKPAEPSHAASQPSANGAEKNRTLFGTLRENEYLTSDADEPPQAPQEEEVISLTAGDVVADPEPPPAMAAPSPRAHPAAHQTPPPNAMPVPAPAPVVAPRVVEPPPPLAAAARPAEPPPPPQEALRPSAPPPPPPEVLRPSVPPPPPPEALRPPEPQAVNLEPPPSARPPSRPPLPPVIEQAAPLPTARPVEAPRAPRPAPEPVPPPAPAAAPDVAARPPRRRGPPTLSVPLPTWGHEPPVITAVMAPIEHAPEPIPEPPPASVPAAARPSSAIRMVSSCGPLAAAAPAAASLSVVATSAPVPISVLTGADATPEPSPRRSVSPELDSWLQTRRVPSPAAAARRVPLSKAWIFIDPPTAEQETPPPPSWDGSMDAETVTDDLDGWTDDDPTALDDDFPEIDEAEELELPALSLRQALDAIAQSDCEEAIAAVFLKYCERRFNRALLFTSRFDVATVLRGYGAGVDDPALRALRIDLNQPSVFATAATLRAPALVTTPTSPSEVSFFAALSEPPGEAIVVPLPTEGRTTDLLYADCGQRSLPTEAADELAELVDAAASALMAMTAKDVG